MALLSINDQSLAVGLSWLEPSSISTNARESRIQREVRSAKTDPIGYAIIATRDGLQLGVTLNDDDVGCQSAAAWLASAQSSAILIDRLEDDRFWLCAVEHGTIFPSGDTVGDRDQIAARLDELLMDAAGSDIPYFDNTGQFDSLVDAAKAGFSDLVNGTEPDSRGVCKTLNSRRVNFPTLALAASVVLVFGGYGSWQLYEKYFDKSKQELSVYLDQEKSNARLREKSGLEEKLTQDSGALLNLFAATVYGRPIRAGGWRVVSHEWKVNTLETVWKRAYGSISDLTSHLGPRGWVLDEATGTVLERSELVAPSTESQPIEVSLGGMKERHEFLDVLASTPGRWTLEPSASTGKMFKTRKSVLRGSSDRLGTAVLAANQLRNQPLILTYIKAELGDSVKWKIQGDYYESAR